MKGITMSLTEVQNRIQELCAAGTRYGLCRSEEIELQDLITKEKRLQAQGEKDGERYNV